jgi:peptidoglycan/xylan/chitin deacetylase (PgdA/CDA1 family)
VSKKYTFWRGGNMGAHGMMFHHFHDDYKHIAEQGSISQNEFEKILDYYSEHYNLVGADEFFFKVKNNKLLEDDVCVTFDDNLLCQFDVAMPVLNKRNLSAFFFAYTSPLDGKPEKLEIYRHFRHLMYSNIDDFYDDFFDTYEKKKKQIGVDESLETSFDENSYLIQYSFYSLNDRKFRYYRDAILGPKLYYEIMDLMIDSSEYNIESNSKILWCRKNELKEISDSGHIVGLHSHTHPTRMCELHYDSQMREYEKCKEILEGILNKKVISASYPCGSINDDTEMIMKKLGIEMAFKERMIPFQSNLMIPRIDHADILKEMKLR